MTVRIAILGANGVYARHLIPRLAASGHQVRALVRRPEAAVVASACAADIRVADIFDTDALRAGLEGCDVCVNLATSLPGPSGRGDFAVNDRVRREGVPLLVDACRGAGVGRLLQQSISWVGASGETLADEVAVFTSSSDDIGGRAVAALEAWPSRKTMIVADDTPVRWRDLFGYVAALAGAAAPEPGGQARLPSFRMSNGLARATLNWAPRYPDYRSGLVR